MFPLNQLNGDLPDLSDPELHKAAITIQAAFKFYQLTKRHRREQEEAQEEAQKVSQPYFLFPP